MNKISVAAVIYLLAVGAFIWGVSTATFKIFPWKFIEPVIAEIIAFSISHPDEPELSPFEKLASDFGGVPFRYVQKDHKPYVPGVPGGDSFSIIRGKIHIRGRHDGPPEGYLAIFGAFQFGNGKNRGVLLLKTDGSLVGGWSTKSVGGEPEIDYERKWIFYSSPHFLSWDCDYSDLDREVKQHTILTGAHHSMELSPTGTYWTHQNNSIVELGYRGQSSDEGSGQIMPSDFEELKRFNLATDLVENTPDISPLTARFSLRWNPKEDPQKTKPIREMVQDPFHNNDVQPFQSSRFPTESGYALLVSVREQNLVMVVNPDNGKILWYRQGLTERQHDLDYMDDGVYVYNNRPFKDFSRIDYIPFESNGILNQGLKTIIDGEDHNWFDPSRGQHDVFEYEDQRYHLVVNDRGGRVMLFDETGKMRFELVNLLGEDPDSTTRLQIKGAMFVTNEQFNRINRGCAAEK